MIKYELKDLFFGTGTDLGRGTALLGTSTTASRLWDERDLGLGRVGGVGGVGSIRLLGCLTG